MLPIYVITINNTLHLSLDLVSHSYTLIGVIIMMVNTMSAAKHIIIYVILIKKKNV